MLKTCRRTACCPSTISLETYLTILPTVWWKSAFFSKSRVSSIYAEKDLCQHPRFLFSSWLHSKVANPAVCSLEKCHPMNWCLLSVVTRFTISMIVMSKGVQWWNVIIWHLRIVSGLYDALVIVRLKKYNSHSWFHTFRHEKMVRKFFFLQGIIKFILSHFSRTRFFHLRYLPFLRCTIKVRREKWTF